MNDNSHQNNYRIILMYVLVISSQITNFTPSWAENNKSKSQLVIRDINAPYPKHCLDENQWKGVEKHSPFNLFDSEKNNAWVPCAYAIKDGGYTLKIELEQTIEVDGIALSQVASNERVNLGKAKKRRKSQKDEVNRHILDTIQILFFNYAISKKYPVYFQDIKFEGKSEIKISYQGMLNWNPRLLGEPLFDERRRALKLSPKGMNLPIHVDKIGIVFPQFDSSKTPPALRELSLFNQGKAYKVKGLKQSKQDYVEVMSKVYLLMVNGSMFVGDDRAMVFAPTGTLWAMEGEEEVAKVIGGWRYNRGRIEVDLSKAQKSRIKPKRKGRIEKSRNRYYEPLHLIVDEAPDRVLIQSGPLQGEYQSVKVNRSNEARKLDTVEEAPSFEMPQ